LQAASSAAGIVLQQLQLTKQMRAITKVLTEQARRVLAIAQAATSWQPTA
jgi:hypothetical protein